MTDPAAAPRVTATEGNPRVVLLTLPTAAFQMAPYQARELGRELIRVADEIVSETVRDAR